MVVANNRNPFKNALWVNSFQKNMMYVITVLRNVPLVLEKRATVHLAKMDLNMLLKVTMKNVVNVKEPVNKN